MYMYWLNLTDFRDTGYLLRAVVGAKQDWVAKQEALERRIAADDVPLGFILQLDDDVSVCCVQLSDEALVLPPYSQKSTVDSSSNWGQGLVNVELGLGLDALFDNQAL